MARLTTDFVRKVDEDKLFKQDFVLNHKNWKSVSVSPTLNWTKIKFSRTNMKDIPKAAGVYAFMIGADNPCLPPFSYLIYIGIAGYRPDSPRTLRDRYADYLKEQATLIRPLLHYFLSKYKDSLYFYYAEIDRDAHSLTEIEVELNDRLKPPANENDFSADVRSKIKAMWR